MITGLILTNTMSNDIDKMKMLNYLNGLPSEIMPESEIDAVKFCISFYGEYSGFPSSSLMKSKIGYTCMRSKTSAPLKYQVASRVDNLLLTYNRKMIRLAGSVADEKDKFKDILSTVSRVTERCKFNVSVINLNNFDRSQYSSFRAANDLFINGLNNIFGGVGNGELFVIAGRLGSGKTSLLMKQCEHMDAQGKRVLFVPTEADFMPTALKFDSIRYQFNPYLIRKDIEKVQSIIEEKSQEIDPCNIIIPTMTGLSVDQVEQLVRVHKPDVLAIDSFYLLRLSKGSSNKWERISTIVLKLKEIATKYNIPVFITTQMNRQSESSETLTAAHISYADDIGTSADEIVAIKSFVDGIYDLRVLKNRWGASSNDSVLLSVDYNTMTYTEFTEDDDIDDDLAFNEGE